MEDLSREFDGEPVKASPTYENAPPKRPEKLLLSENSDMPLAGLPKQSYSRALSSSEARESTTALANPSSENAAVGLNPRLVNSGFVMFFRVQAQLHSFCTCNPGT